MKIIVNGSDLSSAVAKVSKAINSRAVNEVLGGIKLSVKGDELTLTATDTEITIEKKIICDTFEEGEALINGRIFVEFTKKLEEIDQVEISLDKEENRIKIVYENSEVRFAALNVENFPINSDEERDKTFTLLQKDLKEVVGRVIFCCSTNESRPILKGCYFDVLGGVLTAVGIDGVRLATAKKNLINATGDFGIIIPARALGEITRLLEKDEEEITFVFGKNNLKIEVDGTVFITRLLEGQYMDYKRLIPTENKLSVKVARTSFLNGLERAAVVARENSNLVKLDIKDNTITLKAKSESGFVNEKFDVLAEGIDLVIAFNVKFLLDALKGADEDYITMNFIKDIGPVVIKPYSGDEYLYLVLPIKLSD